jgi:hypothetical protein
MNRYEILLGKTPPTVPDFPRKNPDYFVTGSEYHLLGNRNIFLSTVRSWRTSTLANHAKLESSRGRNCLYVCNDSSYVTVFFDTAIFRSDYVPKFRTWETFQNHYAYGNLEKPDTIYFDDITLFDNRGITFILKWLRERLFFNRLENAKILVTCNTNSFNESVPYPDRASNTLFADGYSWDLYRHYLPEYSSPIVGSIVT